MKKVLLGVAVGFLISTAIFYSYMTVNAKSGCCSWHGGVSYCDSSVGTYVCNDGTYSPSCGCAVSNNSFTPATEYPEVLANRLKGKFLLQVEDKGRIWWVDPDTSNRIEMTRENFYQMMRSHALGITNADLNKIIIQLW